MSEKPPPLIQVHRNFYLGIALLYMGGIYYLSSLRLSFDKTDYPDFLSFCGNLFHFPLYTGLGLSLILGFRSSNRSPGRILSRRGIVIALLVLAIYGMFDEYHQSWTGRTPSVSDFLLDLCGGLAAMWFLQFIVDKTLAFKPFFVRFSFLSLAACVLAFVGTYYW